MKTINTFLNEPNKFLIIAGPCALESEDQMRYILNETGNTNVFRAGIFKMRTNPNSFQGLGVKGQQIIKDLKKEFDFEFVTEITDPRQIEMLDEVVDMYQIGSRNMYNYDLLKELNSLNKPVLLKRAFSATVNEWLNAAEYMPQLGEEKIILCERGIRTFETSTRNTLDLNSVIYLKQTTNFKVLVDPSHASGIKSMIEPLSLAAIACGADGLLVETHPNPSEALSDKEQQINCTDFRELKNKLSLYSKIANKEII